jgi:peptide/nickel transport system substrate-binding protein
LNKNNTRRQLVFFSCAGLMILMCAGVWLGIFLVTRSYTVAAQPTGTRITYGLTLLPSGFDPHINASAELGIPLRSVYDTLVYRDPNTKEFVPGLAEKIDISPDGKTYTFTLRSGVTFHDGTVFDAQAVATNLDRITSVETRSQKAVFLLGPYDGYTIVDALTIQIRLRAPYAPLLDGLAQVYTGMASPKALAEYDRDRYQMHQVGTGPYQMVEYIPGDYMLLRRNPDYRWGPPFYRTDNPNPADEIMFRFFTDPSTRAPALESGAADVMGEIPPADALVISRVAGIRLLPQTIAGQPFQFFLNTTNKPLDQLETRRALIVATNRIAVADTIFQQFSPAAFGPLSASSPFYNPKVKDFYPHDAFTASQALLKLGYSDSDKDGILDIEGRKLSLIMVVPSFGFAPQIAQKLQADWRAQGIELELRQVPGLAALREALKSNDYHLIAFNDFGLDPAAFMNMFYRGDGPNNWSRYADGEMDSWLTRATESGDPADRRSLYDAAQIRIMEQAIVLPIRDYVNINGIGKRVNDLSFDAYGWFPLLFNLTVSEG